MYTLWSQKWDGVGEWTIEMSARLSDSDKHVIVEKVPGGPRKGLERITRRLQKRAIAEFKAIIAQREPQASRKARKAGR